MKIVIGLIIGWLIFVSVGRKQGYDFKSLCKYSYSGVAAASNVIIILGIVGMLTALWRASGTIAFIVDFTTQFINLKFLIIDIFLINSFVSFLIGTSFGTAATVGVICMIISNSAGISPLIAGGAVISGIFFGDRSSYVSSSAVLVADVTGSDLYTNMKEMFKTAVIPFGLTCVIYLVMGMLCTGDASAVINRPHFESEFVLSAIAIIPAALVLLLAFFRTNVRISMIVSCISAIVLCFALQHMSVLEVISTMIFGYKASNPEMASIINGGGFMSMFTVLLIVAISATYAGIIENTNILDKITGSIGKIAEKTGRGGCLSIISVLTSMVGCNQTLAIMLTAQLCEDLYDDKTRYAVALENTVVVISPLIPWCIAGAVPVATIGVPTATLLLAFYLYLLPIYEILRRK